MGMNRKSVLLAMSLLVLPFKQYATSFSFITRIGGIQSRGLSSRISSSTYRNRDCWVSRWSRNSQSFLGTSTYTPLTIRQASSVPTTENSLLLDGLNPSQVEAVTQPLQAVTRVIAGPGSGKTRVLTCRVAYLLNQDPRSRVLAVTFTKKAAEEMRHRVESLLLQQQQLRERLDGSSGRHSDGNIVVEDQSGVETPVHLRRVTLGTFHSMCASILRINGDLLESLPSVQEDMVGLSGDLAVNLDGRFTILDTSDQLRILKQCLDEAEIDLRKTDVKPVRILEGIGTIKEAKAQGNDPFSKYGDSKDKKPIPKPLKFAKDVYSLYRQKLLSSNTLDYDDLIFMTREALLIYPSLRERLHGRWPHVLVDEFQDTSVSQMDLVKLLTSKSLFVVGDADQSIYAWRGAHASSLSDVISEFEEFTENGVHTVYLKENYRSTSAIVNAAEKVISADTSNFNSDDPRRAMVPQRESGPTPRITACRDERSEAEYVVSKIIDLIADSSLTSQSTVAIIYRTNSQSRFLEEACVKANLPYVIRGGAGGFYKRAEIKDCLCFLRWIYNGNDESAMIRALQTPSRGLGDKAVEAFMSYCGEVDSYYRASAPGTPRPSKLDILLAMTGEESTSLLQGTPNYEDHIPKRAIKSFLPFAKQMYNLTNEAMTSSVDSLLFSVIEELDLLSHFDSISKSKTEFEERRENVQELRRATKEHSSKGPALLQKYAVESDMDDAIPQSPLGKFLDDVALITDIETEDAGSNESRLVVNLMTIHASKGTEYDAVFLVGIEEGTLPSHLSIQEGEDSIALQEERRLCYVAMTRAKTHLVMTWRKEVSSFASWKAKGPEAVTKTRSRFLDDLLKGNGEGKIKSPRVPSKSVPSKPVLASGQRRLHSSARAPTLGQTSIRQVETPRRSNVEVARQQPRPKQEFSKLKEGGPQRTKSSQSPGYGVMRQAEMRNMGLGSNTARPPSGPHTRNASQTSVKSSLARVPPTKPPGKPQATKPTEPRKPMAIDSTIFYPVGSDVIHENFGKGKVLEPPPLTEDCKSLVRVKFTNGRTMEFPVESKGLVPIF